METIAFAFPVLPSKTEALKELAETFRNEKKEEFKDFLRRLDTIEENWYLQPFGDIDLCICYLAAENLSSAFGKLAASDHPFDSFIKDINKEIFGIDFNESSDSGMPEVLFQFKL